MEPRLVRSQLTQSGDFARRDSCPWDAQNADLSATWFWVAYLACTVFL